MRVLLLADTHANLPALKAVLAAARDIGYDEMWCLGDLVGYGPFPNACARLIRQEAAHVITGNHDAKVVSGKKVQEMADQKKEPYKVFVFSWTHRMLEADVAEYLRSLPEALRLDVHGKKVVLVHGSPEGMSDGLSVLTPEARLVELTVKAKADVLLVAHTHGAFCRKAGDALVINPGAVGRPFDGDPRASFTILEFTAAGVEAKAHRAVYDMTPVAEEMRRQGFPDVLLKAFMEARSPADVMPDGIKGDLVEQAMALGAREGYEKPHALQVARLSLRLFDELCAAHGYAPNGRERALLQAGAILHDIGLARGTEAHHKASRDMILEDKILGLSDRERVIVALLARYHRRSLPGPGHAHYAALPDCHKAMVGRLGGILRMADGLDRSHQALVRDVHCTVAADSVSVKLDAEADIEAEARFGALKSDLFRSAFGKNVEFIR